MSIQEYTNTAQGVAVLATGLNKKGELEKVSTLLASTRFLKGVSIEIAKDAWQQIKNYPTAFIIGSAVALFPSSLAVPAFLALALYRTYCKKDAYIQTYQNFMDAIEKEKYEEAGRYAALLGIDILALKQLYPMLKNTKKIFFGNKNTSKVIEDESQKSKSKLIPTIESLGKVIDTLNSKFINKEQFKEAFELLKSHPEAFSDKSPLKIILSNASAHKPGGAGLIRGAWYEVRKWVALIKSGETVTKVGVKYGDREFDFETVKKLIECKNIDWIKLPSEAILRIKSTFGSQLQIAKSLGKAFEVHSSTPITEEFKEWFKIKGIKFVEDNF